MANGVYSITLSDGTKLEGLSVNGSMFCSEVELKASDFRGKLGHVEIAGPSAGEGSSLVGKHGAMVLDQLEHYELAKHGVPDGWYFALRDIPASEMEALQNRSDIDYIAMMTGVTL